jgi:hypothetical protein
MAKFGKTIGPCIRGDTRTINLTFLQSDGVTPINITGGTVYFSVNASADPSNDSSAAIEFSTPAGTLADAQDTFTASLKGQQQIVLSHTQTNIAAGNYWYDSQFVDSNGNYLSSYRGQFIVQSDIERS